MTHKITNRDFAAAKNAAKQAWSAGRSAARDAAAIVLAERCPLADLPTIRDAAAMAVLAVDCR